jgi:hypothetical protein
MRIITSVSSYCGGPSRTDDADADAVHDTNEDVLANRERRALVVEMSFIVCFVENMQEIDDLEVN